MIDFRKLDKRKKYLVFQYGDSLIAKQIIKCTKNYAPDSKRIPTHVLALVWQYGSWWIYESHMDSAKKLGIPAGVRRYKLDKWLKIEATTQHQFVAYWYPFSQKLLEEFIGYPYGIKDIKSLAWAHLLKRNGKQKDKFGIICSEYLAMCNQLISETLHLPAHCITPAHIQKYVDDLGLVPCG